MDEAWRADGDGLPVGRLEETKRVARILRLISLIGNAPRQWTRSALSERLEIGERQIDKDLQLLRHGLNCGIGHTRAGYYFTRLPQLPAIGYTAAEALALVTALQFARDSGALDAATLGAALARTEEALPAGFGPLLRSMRQAGGGSTQRRRASTLSTLQMALKDRRTVRIQYETASRAGERSDRVVRPYHLALRGQTWLLTAHDSLRGTVIDFAVDRIVSAELLDERYEIPPDFDAEQYRGDGWGVLRGMSGPRVHIELLVTAEEARRLRDEQHHSSQREERQADGQDSLALCPT